MNSYPGLDGQTKFGPTYVYEYSARAAYGSNITWGTDEPLNATWWHLVTERASPLSQPVTISRSDFLFAPRDEIEPGPLCGARISPYQLQQLLIVYRLMFSFFFQTGIQ